jgi:hypothetical protein
MAQPFRYVFEDSLYLGFSQAMPLDDGRKVFGITCPDFDSYFEVIETGNQRSPYLPKASQYVNPFSQKVLEWFCDYKLLYE